MFDPSHIGCACHGVSEMKIVTDYWRKPIPIRCFDWCAVDDSTYGGDETDPIGYGATEQEAIDNLIEQIEMQSE